MADTTTTWGCATTSAASLAAINPYLSLEYHFGQLLGVEDFETEQGYHRGKGWLHNAWLHGAGVVWGYDVKIDTERKEARVTPGLALDGAGRELHLDQPMCVHLVERFLALAKERKVEADDLATTINRDGMHVVIRFKACLARQVPAIAEPCERAQTDTAYSRMFETVDILLMDGPAAVLASPFHRVLLLLGLEPPIMGKDAAGNPVIVPGDQAAIARRDEIAALPGAERSGAVTQWIVDETVALRPAEGSVGPMPFPDTCVVPLANITGLTFQKHDGAWTVAFAPAPGGRVETGIRPLLLPTAVLQKIVLAALQPAAPAPQVVRVDLAANATDLTVTFDRKIDARTVKKAAFGLGQLTAAGWSDVVQSADPVPAADGLTAVVKVAVGLAAPWRLTVRGTGAAPLVGADSLQPLAGAVGDPPTYGNEGRDFVFMQRS